MNRARVNHLPISPVTQREQDVYLPKREDGELKLR